ncbi:MAG: alpha/beta hydrolase family protein [Paracoccaceae bacterium]
MTRLTSALALTATVATAPAIAENRIDVIRPDAPELATHGDYAVGVRTLTLTDPGRIDILNVTDEAIPTYDRPLTVELWYPAAAGTEPGTLYDTVIRNNDPAQLHGMASRDASPITGETFPVVVISHGYPGNRMLMSHLGENLASKGYVTVSIDHTDSTYSDQAAFGSTLVNRPLDQRFVLDQMGNASVIGDDIAAIADTSMAAVLGYSMGGYGALIYGGAGVTQTSVDYTWGAPRGLLGAHLAGSDTHKTLTDDPRVKALIAIGPWGRNLNFWDADGMAGINRPLMLMAGSVDDVSVYSAMRAMFDEATGTDRHLLTFNHANHNAAAPMPAPAEAIAATPKGEQSPADHYLDAVWDARRMNNITQHFATAFLDLHLKGDSDKAAFLALVPNADDGIASLEENGTPKADHSYWTGFAARTATGLRFETKMRGN